MEDIMDIDWKQLQQDLLAVSLKIESTAPTAKYIWGGELDGKSFTMLLAPPNLEGEVKDFMILILCGQVESEVIPKFSQFMGYEPFCKYWVRNRTDPAEIIFEWRLCNSAQRFSDIGEYEILFGLANLQKLAESPASVDLDLSSLYSEFTSAELKYWKEEIASNPDLNWNGQRLKKLLPFFQRVMPRTTKKQSKLNLSIISLAERRPDDEKIVKYGLAPLVKAEIITASEEESILNWFASALPAWNLSSVESIKLEFTIDENSYVLWTDLCRNQRDLNLRVI